MDIYLKTVGVKRYENASDPGGDFDNVDFDIRLYLPSQGGCPWLNGAPNLKCCEVFLGETTAVGQESGGDNDSSIGGYELLGSVPEDQADRVVQLIEGRGTVVVSDGAFITADRSTTPVSGEEQPGPPTLGVVGSGRVLQPGQEVDAARRTAHDRVAMTQLRW